MKHVDDWYQFLSDPYRNAASLLGLPNRTDKHDVVAQKVMESYD